MASGPESLEGGQPSRRAVREHLTSYLRRMIAFRQCIPVWKP